MSTLKLPTAGNSLIDAYRTVKANGGHATRDSAEVVRDYVARFQATVPPVDVQAPRLERFSLIDPTLPVTTKSHATIGTA